MAIIARQFSQCDEQIVIQMWLMMPQVLFLNCIQIKKYIYICNANNGCCYIDAVICYTWVYSLTDRVQANEKYLHCSAFAW